MEENKNQSNLGVASMILGIVSIVLMCIPYIGYASIVVAIIGIVLAAKAKKEGPSGMATAGLVCSIIALALWVIMIIAVIACGAALGIGALGAAAV